MSLPLLVTSLSVGVTVSATGLGLGGAYVSALAQFAPSNNTEVRYDVPNDNYEQRVCTHGSQCRCTVGPTLFGTSIICVKCPDAFGCETICMADHPDCKQCLLTCHDVGGCECVQDCKRKCTLPENPVTRIAVGCGILFLATALLAFFFKVFLMCCLTTVGRSRRYHEDDTASLNSVDRLVAQRLRDAPPRYDALVDPNSQIGEPRPQNVPSPPDKPPPYNLMPNAGELCLQVSTLPDAPPPYSLSYLNSSLPQTPTVTSPPTPPANPSPLPRLEPGHELCRTFTM